MKIKNVTDPEFRRYGRIVDGYDFTEMIKVMEQTPLPEEVRSDIVMVITAS